MPLPRPSPGRRATLAGIAATAAALAVAPRRARAQERVLNL